ncbi:hypothetical protein [Hymenobacter cellulosivorans]|uniref:Glycosyltransferase RgtA/B/C/D-like domain-containing protein n=1 Tax=Hymenobacter cellulosivorans TaxID=2932249 RepID=A0ABY4F3C2_9BACT|nr:hypothetical protein [Hymenobacter cellulosivorans]UOQ51159.1 hypothetical protein MUN80_15465 [Hymenobacter cellulosivorans]
MNEPETVDAPRCRSRPVGWWLTGGIFLLYCLYLPFSGYSEMVYDALGYWNLTERFFRGGRFHLLAYDNALRGYLLPLLNLPAKAAVHFTGAAPLTLTRLMGAAYAAALFGWAGPGLWLRLFPQHRLGWLPRLAFAGLGFLFWRDYFNFVLSDFPALLALVLSLWLVLGRQGWTLAVLAGACLTAASNIRPVYLLAAPVVLVLGLLTASNHRHRLVNVLGLLLGFALIAGPQLLLNLRHHHVATPLVLSRDARLPTANLYLAQLGWGVVIQKYETSLDPSFPAPRMLYTDAAGQALLRRLNIHHFTGYGPYLATVLREPLAFAGLYGRHLFNGLDVQYPSLFVVQVAARSSGLAGLHYSVWFGALLVAGCGIRRGAFSGRVLLTGVALLLPCLAALPLATECRFLLPLQLLLYAIACFGGAQWRPSWPAVSWPKIALAAAAYVVFLLLCFRLSAQTQAQLTADVRVLAPLGSAEAPR